jgi:hypothetical protein
MAKREKRLQKGIDSLEKQIEIHKDKKENASFLGKKDLERYYDKEIEKLEERRRERQEKLNRKE